ncbi:MAG TPA: ABC transporter substrate-binding protein [Xanthobacteraceae bacterium]|nr:ABC transporter substrate-binding protein [Xanthobacteraceae bacterium]
MKHPVRWLALIAAAVIGAGAAQAADVDMAAAKKEGKITWYTSTPIKTAQELAALFEKDTGIHVELFRSGGSAILRRFMQEQTAGVAAADVLTTSDPANSMTLAAHGLFVPFKPDNFDKVPEGSKDPKGAWVAQRLNMMVIYVDGAKIAAADAPMTWTAALDPKYKGKLAMTDPSFTALQLMVVSTLSRKLGWDYYKKLKANDVMIVQGNQQVLDAIKSGERPIALGALDSYAADARKQGHKIRSVYPQDGTFIIPSPTAVIKSAPHPNAARAFADFMLSDAAQKLFPKNGGYAARTDIDPPADSPRLSDVKPMPVDYAQIQKDAGTVKRQFNEIFQ